MRTNIENELSLKFVSIGKIVPANETINEYNSIVPKILIYKYKNKKQKIFYPLSGKIYDQQESHTRCTIAQPIARGEREKVKGEGIF